MNSEQWQKVKELFDAALALAPAERGKFLKNACGTDDELRREVENLLVSFDEAENFMEKPAAAEVAGLIVVENEKLKSGQRVAHYETLRQIGEGGMGEVYLAKDTRLNRQVALKILPAHLTTDKSRLWRFKQEAQAASALNHPNIITIYEIREYNETHLIATEFVEGETIRQKMAGVNLKTSEILDIIVQVTSALSVAHNAGVIHRDIKPENIMIRPDGIVKLLDFGLAKLAETSAAKSPDVSTKQLTNPGMVMGTVNYMSPEQAQGKAVDRRTDLWSLGVCLYEMLAGKAPFTGKTINHTLVAIMENQPPPLAQIARSVPAELGRITVKLLEKKPENRYLTANDLLFDLRRLQKLLESESNQSESPHFTTAKTEQFPENTFVWESVSGAPTPNNLSGQLLPLVGREKEIAEITNLLRRDSIRLLTLTGIGGTGKTRLAFEIAAERLAEFADGVFFVPLAAVNNWEFVASEIAQPLGVKDAGGKSLLETLKDFLREKQILLVVDNFEQVLPAAPVLSELLAAAPRLKMLVTSRALLRLRVEREFIVPPLEVPSDINELSTDDLLQYESVKLFMERAQAVKSNLAATKENLQITAEICARLDGLPLAIELAAARVKILSPGAILSRLESSLKLLTGGSQDLPAHQQTMRGAIEWSYDLLDEQEKILFRRLAVFAGGFTIEAAEAVCGNYELRITDYELSEDQRSKTGDQINVLDLIASLVDKSLLVRKEQADGESRFRLLEVVREYALEILQASGESEMIRENHAAFFLALAQKAEPEFFGEQSGKWLDRLDEEHDNLRAAISWSAASDAETMTHLAGALRNFWILRNYLPEGRKWLETALEKSDDAPLSVRFKLLNGLGHTAGYQGDLETAWKAHEKGLAEGKAANDLRQIALSNRGLGFVAKWRNDITTARKFYEEGLANSRALEDKSGIAVSLTALGELARMENDFKAARPLYEKALEISRQTGNKQSVVSSLNNLGATAFGEGDYPAARLYYAESIALVLQLGEKISLSYALDGFAALAVKSGEAERAAQLAGVAIYLRESLGFDTEPAERRFRDAYLIELQTVLDEENFAALCEQGRALSLKKAVALALQKSNAGGGDAITPFRTPSEKLNDTTSIAVLPFLTLGLTSDEEYLGLGLADALITQLSQARQLVVRPTNAVRSFTDAVRDAAEIGKKLNVGTVLEGNLQKSGERLRVTVQLINVKTGATLWADKFSVNFTDFFEVQDQIAEQVSKALLLKLSTSEEAQINKRFTESNAAYLEYLRGRHFWEKRDVAGFHKAIEHFKKAIDLDPTYALAYVGLSDVYCMLGIWTEYPQDEIFPRAKAAARRALEIDEKLADAHASMGRVQCVYEWDWAAAENSYLRAIELNPGCLNAHSWLAKVYILKHRYDEAIEESHIAQKLDPLSPQTEVSLAAAHFYARRYTQATEKYRKALKMHPDFVPAIFGLGMCLAENGEFDEAIALQTKAVELSKNHPLIEGFLAATYAYSGNREKALEFIEKFKSLQDKSLDYTIAAVYSRLNDRERAFEYLEKSFADRYRELSGVSIEPEFDNLRGEPLFNEMLRRVGLEEAIVKQPVEEQIYKPIIITQSDETQTLAVLPFSIIGLSEDEEYLGLGLADALITQLSQTRQLTVCPTNAVRQYLNQKQDAMKIGRELRVGAVLEGNLQRAGENLRVTVQLINTESDATLWAEKFNLKFTDFFEVQDQIAEQVSRALLLKLNSEERQRMTKRYTENNAAYLEYLKGRYQWNKREVEGFNRAVRHFKAAIDHDPTFALAYAGLADAYSMLPMWGEGTSQDLCPRAKAAAQKALEIDENLAEAHASLGYVNYVYDWDFAGAENSYRRAIALNPNYALVRAWYAKFLVVMRRFDEAFEQIKLAYALDPLSPQTGASFGGFYLYSGQYDEAVRHYSKMLQINPNFVPALLGLGQSYGQKGFFKEAVETHEKAVLHSAEHPILLGVLACSKALAGERDEARKIAEKLEQLVADCPMLPYSIATVYACLNEKQAAFEWLEKAYTERNSHLPDINIDPEFDNLRGDSRFEDLRRRIGFTAQAADEKIEEKTILAAKTSTDTTSIRPTSSAEYIVTEAKKHKRGIFWILILFLIATASFTGYYFYNVR